MPGVVGGVFSSRIALASVAVALVVAVACGGTARADPNQDQQFLALLAQKQIAAIDNVPGLLARAHEICSEFDHGSSFPTVLNEESNTAYRDNASLRLVPDRVTATGVRFITASVDVYCPYHRGELP